MQSFSEDINTSPQDNLIQDQQIFNQFPFFLQIDDITYDIKNFTIELLDQVKERKNDIKLLQFIVRNTKRQAFQNPNREISEFYYNLLNAIKEEQKDEPDIFIDYEEIQISPYLNNSWIPNLQEQHEFIDSYKENKDKTDLKDLRKEKSKIWLTEHLDPEELYSIQYEMYNFWNGVIPNYYRLNQYFPNYLIRSWRTFSHIFSDDEFIKLEEKQIVAIMVCSLLECQYFYDQFQIKYLFWDGDKSWIFEAKDKLPARLLKLKDLSINLLKKPWKLFDDKKITELDQQDYLEGDTFNISEQLHFCTLICKVAGMCSTSLALKLSREIRLFNLEDSEQFMSDMDLEVSRYSHKSEQLGDLQSDDMMESIDSDKKSDKNQTDQSTETNTQSNDYKKKLSIDDKDKLELAFDINNGKNNSKEINIDSIVASYNTKNPSQISFKKKANFLQVLESQTSIDNNKNHNYITYQQMKENDDEEPNNNFIKEKQDPKDCTNVKDLQIPEKQDDAYEIDTYMFQKKSGGVSPKSGNSFNTLEEKTDTQHQLFNLFFWDKIYEKTRYNQDELKQFKMAKIKYSTYNLETQGYSLMEKFNASISHAISDQQKHAYNMTFHTFGQYENINTIEFRQGIQYYVKALFGYKHDDYNYQKTNTIFTKTNNNENQNKQDTISAKNFIKKLSTDPYSCNKLDYDKITDRFDLRSNELFHIIILVEDTKFDVSLVYFTATLDKYIKAKT